MNSKLKELTHLKERVEELPADATAEIATLKQLIAQLEAVGPDLAAREPEPSDAVRLVPITAEDLGGRFARVNTRIQAP